VATAVLLVAGIAVSSAAPSKAGRCNPNKTACARTTSLPLSEMLFDSNRTGNYEIFAMRTDGSAPRQVTADPVYDSWWPKLSPDRTQIMFHRTPKGTHDRDYAKTSIWMVGVDGSGLREVVPNRAFGWQLLGHPEWSPDGSEIVVFAGATNAPQIYVLRSDGTAPRAVTQRVGQNLDPSWSPDGQSILFIGCPGSICPHTSYEVYRIGRDGTGEVRLTNDLSRDHDPYFSPDGTRIAWLRLGANWGISSMAADGSDQRKVISDLNINSKPAWAVDGSWIYFHRTPVGRIGFNVFRIRPDGTELRELVPRPLLGFGPYDNEYPIHGLL
jgi:Tol biopolymer transport system component